MNLYIHSYMKYKYTVTVKEEGKGRGTVAKFATLLDAQAYVKARWQGAEYADSNYSFHTDYSTYELSGFDLTQIGTFTYNDWSQDYAFLDLTRLNEEIDDAGIYVVTSGDDDRDAQPYTFRCTGARLKQLRANTSVVVYSWATLLAYESSVADPESTYDFSGISQFWVEPPTAVEVSNFDGEECPF